MPILYGVHVRARIYIGGRKEFEPISRSCISQGAIYLEELYISKYFLSSVVTFLKELYFSRSYTSRGVLCVFGNEIIKIFASFLFVFVDQVLKNIYIIFIFLWCSDGPKHLFSLAMRW
jgi:hypothetical protein